MWAKDQVMFKVRFEPRPSTLPTRLSLHPIHHSVMHQQRSPDVITACISLSTFDKCEAEIKVYIPVISLT